MDDQKLQYFPNFLKGRVVDRFVKYEMTHPTTTWDEVQWAFISQLVRFVMKDKRLQL
jgi:hypothetical protein